MYSAGDSIVVTVNTTAVAQWTEIPTTVTISFYANGGEGEMEAATPDENGHYTLPENEFTAPEGKEFIGWQVGEEDWQVGDEITVERNFIRQRQAEGIAAAKARGQRFGRPKKERSEEYHDLVVQWKDGRLSATDAAQCLGVARNTFMKWVREDAK